MNEQTVKLIQELSDKLGTTAEHLWGVMVRQAPISGVIGLLIDVAAILLLMIGWKKLSKINFDKWDDDFGKGALYAALIVATLVSIIGIASSLPTEISGIINPEYWALKQILK